MGAAAGFFPAARKAAEAEMAKKQAMEKEAKQPEECAEAQKKIEEECCENACCEDKPGGFLYDTAVSSYARRQSPEALEASQAAADALDKAESHLYLGATAGLAAGAVLGLALLRLRTWMLRKEFRKAMREHNHRKMECQLSHLKEQEARAEAQRMDAQLKGFVSRLVGMLGGSDALEREMEDNAAPEHREGNIAGKDRRLERQREIEEAIRKICGRDCSVEVSAALASALSDKSIRALLERPETLPKVLSWNRERIDQILRRHGWDADSVIRKIEERKGRAEKGED